MPSCNDRKFWKFCKQGSEFDALWTHIPKSFNCIDHEILITKLSWCGISVVSITLISSSLSIRTQQVKVETDYSDRCNIDYGVPQALNLGPSLFNIDLIGFFYASDDSRTANFAIDTTPYHLSKDIPSEVMQLQSTASKLFSWLANNHMKVNSHKCHNLLGTENPIGPKIYVLKRHVPLPLLQAKNYVELE